MLSPPPPPLRLEPAPHAKHREKRPSETVVQQSSAGEGESLLKPRCKNKAKSNKAATPAVGRKNAEELAQTSSAKRRKAENDEGAPLLEQLLSDNDRSALMADIVGRLATLEGLPEDEGEEGTKEMLAEYIVCLLVEKKGVRVVQRELQGFLEDRAKAFVTWLAAFLRGPWAESRARAAAAAATVCKVGAQGTKQKVKKSRKSGDQPASSTQLEPNGTEETGNFMEAQLADVENKGNTVCAEGAEVASETAPAAEPEV